MKRQHGFGLIEVMLAFVIVAATAGTLLQLNKTYLEYSRDGRSREVAMRLAESKLDELRRFQSRNGFNEITDGSDTVNLDNNEYARNWAVTESGNAQKQVVVTINWNDGGEALSFTLGTTISLNISAISGSLGTASKHLGAGKGGPKVKHTPGLFPDVVAIDLGDGLKQETSKPVVTVAKNDSTSVRVSEKTTLYDASNNKVQEQELETVSCNCKLSGTASPQLPAQRTLLGNFSYWKKGGDSPSQINTGVPENKDQDEFCDLCCKNHFDGPNGDFSHWYDAIKAKNNSHTHTSTYTEACRLVRVDGSFVVANDWNLVVLNVMGKDTLDETGIGNKRAEYGQYVRKVAIDYFLQMLIHEYDFQSYKNVVRFNDFEAGVGEITVEPPLDSKKLIARGIYIDLLSESNMKEIKDNVLEGRDYSNYEDIPEKVKEKLIKHVPFSDVQLSDRVSWSSKEPCATVDSQGNISPTITSGSCEVEIASIRRSNSGRTGAAITTAEETDRKTASITVTVVP